MIFDTPINKTSLGQTGFNIFLALSRKTDVSLFPYGNNVDLSAFNLNENSQFEINKSISKAFNIDKSDNVLQLWHIQDSERVIKGNKNCLFTFHETDRLTSYETNRLEQKDVIFVSSKYTKSIFDFYSTANVIYCPLGFDSNSFFKTKKEETEVISFGLRGKIEKRKHTVKIIKNWIKAFGGDPRYRLDLSISNFFVEQDPQLLVLRELEEKTIPWNVNFLPYFSSNILFNEALNNVDIDLTGLSGCEGFNLPCFQSLCLGKQAVVLNAHVHKDYCNEKNSILVEPKELIPAIDNIFFHSGAKTNQGYWFDFDDDDCISAMKVAALKAKENNTEGERLKEWTFDKTADIILANV